MWTATNVRFLAQSHSHKVQHRAPRSLRDRIRLYGSLRQLPSEVREHHATMRDGSRRQVDPIEWRLERPSALERARAAAVFFGPIALEAQRVIAIGPDLAAVAEPRLARVAGLAVLAKRLGFVGGG